MIYIIADDLTGANDTGVQFAKNGYNTKVAILNDELSDINFTGEYDVFVIDSETREAEETNARNKLKVILKSININEKDIVYKKIDSTLRGNVGAEIEEVIKTFKKQFCIISPSYPALQRITVDGNLFVQNKLLEFSAYFDKSHNKNMVSFIPSILKQQTKLAIGRIDLSEVNKGQHALIKLINELIENKKKIIVIDSKNEKNLRDIVSSGMKFADKILFSGSAGLANHLVENFIKKRKINIKIEDNKEPILIVGGSKNPVMLDQIHYVTKQMEFAELKIDINQIFCKEKIAFDRYLDKCLEIIKKSQNLIIYSDAIYNKKELIDEKIMNEFKLSYKELGNKIKEFYGKLTAALIREGRIKNLILTGGDIAVSVCKGLNISELKLVGEILPGIPLTNAQFNNITLNIITKAGGFGKKETFYELVNVFRNI